MLCGELATGAMLEYGKIKKNAVGSVVLRNYDSGVEKLTKVTTPFVDNYVKYFLSI